MRLKSNRGFTLTEAMVGLVIFGIIMAASYPNLARSNRNHRLMSAASEIEATLTRARSSAVTTQNPVRVTLNAAQNQLVVERDTTGDGNFDTQVRSVDIDGDIAFTNVAFGNGAAVTFNGRGAPDNPGIVVLSNGGESGQRILVSAGSGAVSVKSVPLYESPGDADGQSY
jgi:prepilin-type N-terminal cleavage/methylation domain-containing protein